MLSGSENAAEITCRTFPCDRLSLGVRQFNERHYFECHETLEDLWVEERGAIRDLYRGILQIGIGLLHWEKGNFKGAPGRRPDGRSARPVRRS